MPKSERRRNKILIVDRNESDRLLFTKVLRKAGYEVQEARGPREAAALLERLTLDLILLEVGPSAEDLTSAERLATASPAPVVAVALDPSAKPRALAAGCAACLVKPVEVRRLAGQVHVVLDRALVAPEPA